MIDVLKKFGVVSVILVKLVLSLIIVGVGLIYFFNMIGIESPMDGIISSQIAVLVFGLSLYNFKKEEALNVLKKKIDAEVIFKALIITAIVLAINVILSEIISSDETTSKTVEDLLAQKSFLAVIFFPVFIAPFVEELTFRGGLKYALVDKENFSKISYVLISAIIFGSLHYQPGPLMLTQILLTGCMGIVYGIVYLKYNNVYISMFSHLMYNGLIMGIAFSGK